MGRVRGSNIYFEWSTTSLTSSEPMNGINLLSFTHAALNMAVLSSPKGLEARNCVQTFFSIFPTFQHRIWHKWISNKCLLVQMWVFCTQNSEKDPLDAISSPSCFIAFWQATNFLLPVLTAESLSQLLILNPTTTVFPWHLHVASKSVSFSWVPITFYFAFVNRSSLRSQGDNCFRAFWFWALYTGATILGQWISEFLLPQYSLIRLFSI